MEIEYKGFVAKVTFSPSTDTFSGEVLNASDVLAFQVSDPAEALLAMRETVDCYLKYVKVKEWVRDEAF